MMQYQSINENTFVIKIKRGEKIIESLQKFCQKEKVVNGFFYGLGAVDWVKLGEYNVSTKKYHEVEFNKEMELTNITGNVADFPDGIIIHSHATVSDHDMQAFGGHLADGRVSGTAEIYLTKFDTNITKKYDEETGLKLMELNETL
jgi:hypothetical protein